MTRRVSIVLASMVVAAGVTLVAQSAGPTLEEIVAHNLQAKGGAEKVQAVQTMKQTAHVTFQGMTGTITVYGKRPNLVRQEMTVNGQMVVSAFDGTTAWSINPFRGSADPVTVTGPQAEDIKKDSDFDSPLVNYKAKGSELELVGTETLGSRKVYHLKLTTRDKHVQQLYLDAETYLEVKVVGETSMGPVENELSDYRDVSGLKLPFSMRTLSAGNVVSQIVVDKIELNPKLDDSLFKLPKVTGR